MFKAAGMMKTQKMYSNYNDKNFNEPKVLRDFTIYEKMVHIIKEDLAESYGYIEMRHGSTVPWPV